MRPSFLLNRVLYAAFPLRLDPINAAFRLRRRPSTPGSLYTDVLYAGVLYSQSLSASVPPSTPEFSLCDCHLYVGVSVLSLPRPEVHLIRPSPLPPGSALHGYPFSSPPSRQGSLFAAV